MMEKSRTGTLIVYTKNYPFGRGEAFLHNELLFLCKRFDRVLVLPLDAGKNKSEMRVLPANVELVTVKPVAVSLPEAALHVLLLLLREKKCWAHLKHFRYAASYFRNIVSYEQAVQKLATQYPEAIHYTYWFEDWALLLARMKRKGHLPAFVSRAHGYDLFEQRWQHGFIPFRSFQLRQVNRLIFASRDAFEWSAKVYAFAANKFAVSPIGTYDHGLAPVPLPGVFHLVSCSNLIPLKRVSLLVQALKETEFPVHWTHFGDGPLMQTIQREAADLPQHVTYTLVGAVDNDRLMDFYRTRPVNAMALLSETEGGVPVSLQEAASFGIPLLGAKSGGIPEIVNDQTGILLPHNAGATEVKNALHHLHNGGFSIDAVYREGVRRFWKKHYDATVNFGRLYEILVADMNHIKHCPQV